MNGTLWIASYVVLWIGVVAALAVALNLAHQLGRFLSGAHSSGGSEEPPGHGLPSGIPFPHVQVVAIDGSVVEPAGWERAVIIQVVVRSPEDVEALAALGQFVPTDLLSATIVSAIGRSDLLDEVQDVIHPAVLVHDRELTVESILRTKYRPHAVVLSGGRVLQAKTFGSGLELGDFILHSLNQAHPAGAAAKEVTR